MRCKNGTSFVRRLRCHTTALAGLLVLAHALNCSDETAVPPELLGGGNVTQGLSAALVFLRASSVALALLDGSRVEACLTSAAYDAPPGADAALLASLSSGTAGSACVTGGVDASAALQLNISAWLVGAALPLNCSGLPVGVGLSSGPFSANFSSPFSSGCPPVAAGGGIPSPLWVADPALGMAYNVLFPPIPHPLLPSVEVAAVLVGVSAHGLSLEVVAGDGGTLPPSAAFPSSLLRLDYCAASVQAVSAVDGTPLPPQAWSLNVTLEVRTGDPGVCYWLRRTGGDNSLLQYRFGGGGAACPTAWQGAIDDDASDDDGAGAPDAVTLRAFGADPTPSPQPSLAPAYTISDVQPRVLSSGSPTLLTITGDSFEVFRLLGSVPPRYSAAVNIVRRAAPGAAAVRVPCAPVVVANGSSLTCLAPPVTGAVLQVQLRASSPNSLLIRPSRMWPSDDELDAGGPGPGPLPPGAVAPIGTLSSTPPRITGVLTPGGGAPVPPPGAPPPAPQISSPLTPTPGTPLLLRPGEVVTLSGVGFGARGPVASANSGALSPAAAASPGEGGNNADGGCVFLGWDVPPAQGSSTPWVVPPLLCDGALGHPGEGEVPWCRLLAWNDTHIEFVVPPGAVGARLLTVGRAGQLSASVRVAYAPPASPLTTASAPGASPSLPTLGGGALGVGVGLGAGPRVVAANGSAPRRTVWLLPTVGVGAPGGGLFLGPGSVSPPLLGGALDLLPWPAAGLQGDPAYPEPIGWLMAPAGPAAPPAPASGSPHGTSTPTAAAAPLQARAQAQAAAVLSCAASEAARGSFDPLLQLLQSPWGCVVEAPSWGPVPTGNNPLLAGALAPQGCAVGALPPGTVSPLALGAASDAAVASALAALPPGQLPQGTDAAAVPQPLPRGSVMALLAVFSGGPSPAPNASAQVPQTRALTSPPGLGTSTPLSLSLLDPWGPAPQAPPTPAPWALRVAFLPPTVAALDPPVVLLNGSGFAGLPPVLRILGQDLGLPGTPANSSSPLFSGPPLQWAQPLDVRLGAFHCGASRAVPGNGPGNGSGASGGAVALECVGLSAGIGLGSSAVLVTSGGQASAPSSAPGGQGAAATLTVGCGPQFFGIPRVDPQCRPCPAHAVCPGYVPETSTHSPPIAVAGYFDIGPALGASGAPCPNSGPSNSPSATPGTSPSGGPGGTGTLVCITPCSPAAACLGGGVCASGFSSVAGGACAPQSPNPGSRPGIPAAVTLGLGLGVPLLLAASALAYFALVAPARRSAAVAAALSGSPASHRRSAAAAWPPLPSSSASRRHRAPGGKGREPHLNPLVMYGMTNPVGSSGGGGGAGALPAGAPGCGAGASQPGSGGGPVWGVEGLEGRERGHLQQLHPHHQAQQQHQQHGGHAAHGYEHGAGAGGAPPASHAQPSSALLHHPHASSAGVVFVPRPQPQPATPYSAAALLAIQQRRVDEVEALQPLLPGQAQPSRLVAFSSSAAAEGGSGEDEAQAPGPAAPAFASSPYSATAQQQPPLRPALLQQQPPVPQRQDSSRYGRSVSAGTRRDRHHRTVAALQPQQLPVGVRTRLQQQQQQGADSSSPLQQRLSALAQHSPDSSRSAFAPVTSHGGVVVRPALVDRHAAFTRPGTSYR